MFSIIWITSHLICKQITCKSKQNPSRLLKFPKCIQSWTILISSGGETAESLGLRRTLTATLIHFLPFRRTYLTHPRREKINAVFTVLQRKWFHFLTQQSILTGTSPSFDLDTSSLSWRIVSARKLLSNYNLNPCVYFLLSFAKSRCRAAHFYPLCKVALSSPGTGVDFDWLDSNLLVCLCCKAHRAERMHTTPASNVCSSVESWDSDRNRKTWEGLHDPS